MKTVNFQPSRPFTPYGPVSNTQTVYGTAYYRVRSMWTFFKTTKNSKVSTRVVNLFISTEPYAQQIRAVIKTLLTASGTRHPRIQCACFTRSLFTAIQPLKRDCVVHCKCEVTVGLGDIWKSAMASWKKKDIHINYDGAVGCHLTVYTSIHQWCFNSELPAGNQMATEKKIQSV